MGTDLIPDQPGTRNLGDVTNKWDIVFANTLMEHFTGTADTAEQVIIGTNTTNATFYLTFVDSANSLQKQKQFIVMMQ